jgi:iron-sulfur cluster repair protein YtfE (RIC family)
MFDLLHHDHEELSTLVDQLLAELDSNNATRAFALLDLFWAKLAMHIRAENLHLFPTILNKSKSTNAPLVPATEVVESAIKTLKDDHNFFMDQLAQAIKAMRKSMDKCTSLAPIKTHVLSVTDRLVAHNALEEQQVYKWPASILSPQELESLSAALKKELDNLPPRFESP